MENGPCIDVLAIKHGDFPVRYVSLPKGMSLYINIIICIYIYIIYHYLEVSWNRDIPLVLSSIFDWDFVWKSHHPMLAWGSPNKSTNTAFSVLSVWSWKPGPGQTDPRHHPQTWPPNVWKKYHLVMTNIAMEAMAHWWFSMAMWVITRW